MGRLPPGGFPARGPAVGLQTMAPPARFGIAEKWRMTARSPLRSQAAGRHRARYVSGRNNSTTTSWTGASGKKVSQRRQ